MGDRPKYFAFDNIFLSVYLKKTTIIMVTEAYDWSNCWLVLQLKCECVPEYIFISAPLFL